MEVITEHRTGVATKKPFTWSYSKLKNFETCPLRYLEVDVEKKHPEPDNEQLLWGNAVHAAAAKRISQSVPLPITMHEMLEPWVARIMAGGEAIYLVEQKLALTRQFGPCGYFAKDVWFRGVGDVIKIMQNVALIVDWKTGKIIEDGAQLALGAACVFAHYPEVQRVRSEFIWLKEDASTRSDFTRENMRDIWRSILPRVDLLEQAYNLGLYPAKPGYLCKRYCSVSSCAHHGK